MRDVLEDLEAVEREAANVIERPPPGSAWSVQAIAAVMRWVGIGPRPQSQFRRALAGALVGFAGVFGKLPAEEACEPPPEPQQQVVDPARAKWERLFPESPYPKDAAERRAALERHRMRLMAQELAKVAKPSKAEPPLTMTQLAKKMNSVAIQRDMETVLRIAPEVVPEGAPCELVRVPWYPEPAPNTVLGGLQDRCCRHCGCRFVRHDDLGAVMPRGNFVDVLTCVQGHETRVECDGKLMRLATNWERLRFEGVLAATGVREPPCGPSRAGMRRATRA